MRLISQVGATIATALFSSVAHGGEPLEIVHDPLRAHHEESERDERATDTIALGAGTFLYNLVGVGVGAEVGLYLGADTLIFADATMAESRFPRATSTTIGLGLTRFIGDIFYLRGSGRLRGFTLDIKTDPELLEDEAREFPPADEVETRDFGIDVAVGFQRKWGRFSLTTDVLGAYVPLLVRAKAAYADTPEGRIRIPYEERETIPEFRVAYVRAGVSF